MAFERLWLRLQHLTLLNPVKSASRGVFFHIRRLGRLEKMIVAYIEMIEKKTVPTGDLTKIRIQIMRAITLYEREATGMLKALGGVEYIELKHIDQLRETGKEIIKAIQLDTSEPPAERAKKLQNATNQIDYIISKLENIVKEYINELSRLQRGEMPTAGFNLGQASLLKDLRYAGWDERRHMRSEQREQHKLDHIAAALSKDSVIPDAEVRRMLEELNLFVRKEEETLKIESQTIRDIAIEIFYIFNNIKAVREFINTLEHKEGEEFPTGVGDQLMKSLAGVITSVENKLQQYILAARRLLSDMYSMREETDAAERRKIAA